MKVGESAILEAQKDAAGGLLDGVFVSVDGSICRFRGGYLDGDSYFGGDKLYVRPAVEGCGYIEYRRHGILHRDGGLPAVILEGFRVKEYWEYGEFIKRVELDK